MQYTVKDTLKSSTSFLLAQPVTAVATNFMGQYMHVHIAEWTIDRITPEQ